MKKNSGRKGNGTGEDTEKKPESPGIPEFRDHGGAVPGRDAGRVESLRDAVAGGIYRVEPRKVAGKIVDEAVREIRNRNR